MLLNINTKTSENIKGRKQIQLKILLQGNESDWELVYPNDQIMKPRKRSFGWIKDKRKQDKRAEEITRFSSMKSLKEVDYFSKKGFNLRSPSLNDEREKLHERIYISWDPTWYRRGAVLTLTLKKNKKRSFGSVAAASLCGDSLEWIA